MKGTTKRYNKRKIASGLNILSPWRNRPLLRAGKRGHLIRRVRSTLPRSGGTLSRPMRPSGFGDHLHLDASTATATATATATLPRVGGLTAACMAPTTRTGDTTRDKQVHVLWKCLTCNASLCRGVRRSCHHQNVAVHEPTHLYNPRRWRVGQRDEMNFRVLKAWRMCVCVCVCVCMCVSVHKIT